MSEQIACRDTTFDNVIPKSLWISVNNCNEKRELEVSYEVDGIKKTIFCMDTFGIDDGNHSQSHNLSWLLAKADHSDSIRLDYGHSISKLEAKLAIAVDALKNYGIDYEGKAKKALQKIYGTPGLEPGNPTEEDK